MSTPDLDRHPAAQHSFARPAGRLPRARSRARRALTLTLHWAPLGAALLLLGQLAWFGWRPARAERQRLERAEQEVRARADRLRAEEAELRRDQRMLADEIYQERVRRSQVDPAATQLTLERARQVAGQ